MKVWLGKLGPGYVRLGWVKLGWWTVLIIVDVYGQRVVSSSFFFNDLKDWNNFLLLRLVESVLLLHLP